MSNSDRDDNEQPTGSRNGEESAQQRWSDSVGYSCVMLTQNETGGYKTAMHSRLYLSPVLY